MSTKLQRIDLSIVEDLEKAITDSCDIQETAGLKLAATFVYDNQLVLIFQS